MSHKKWATSKKQTLSEKILLHLANCVDFGFSYKAKKEFGISGKTINDLMGADEKEFKDCITGLRKLKFIEKRRIMTAQWQFP